LLFWLVSLLKPRYRAALLLALLPTALVMLSIWRVPGVLIGTTTTFLDLSLFFGAGTVLLKQRSANAHRRRDQPRQAMERCERLGTHPVLGIWSWRVSAAGTGVDAGEQHWTTPARADRTR